MTHPGFHATPAIPSVAPRLTVVLHADDFGMSASVNRGIISAFSHGILTSTSLLANAPAVAEAIQSWNELELRRRHRVLPGDSLRRELRDPALPFDLGVHLNLTQGRPLTANYPGELLTCRGLFPGVGRLFVATLRRLPRGTAELVRQELAMQVEFLLDSGIPLQHINGHQYVECLPLVAQLLPGLAAQYGIPSVRVACEQNLGRILAEGRWTAWALALVKRRFARAWQSRAVAAGLSSAETFVGTAHAGRWDAVTLAWYLSRVRGKRVEVGLHPGAEVRSDLRLVEPSAADPESLNTVVATRADVRGLEGWTDPLALGRPRELALLTAPDFVARLAVSGCCLGRLSEWRQMGLARGWRAAG